MMILSVITKINDACICDICRWVFGDYVANIHMLLCVKVKSSIDTSLIANYISMFKTYVYNYCQKDISLLSYFSSYCA